MKDCYYIGNRKRKKIRHPFLFFLFLSLALLLLLNAVLYPHVLAQVKSRVTSRVSALSAERIAQVLADEQVEYSSLILIHYDTSGAVRSVSVDTVRLALLKQRLALSLLSALQEETRISVSVPLGNLMGFYPLSGQGKAISVSVTASDSLRASFVSSFTEAGINQTRHSISFSFEITVYCFFSGRVKALPFHSTFPAAETVIVGDVPDSLTQISRLTDDITEYDIDDAVDFGNIIN